MTDYNKSIEGYKVLSRVTASKLQLREFRKLALKVIRMKDKHGKSFNQIADELKLSSKQYAFFVYNANITDLEQIKKLKI